MDKLSRLQAMLGEETAFDSQGTSESDFGGVAVAKPRHLYEGTDSEDDMMHYQSSGGKSYSDSKRHLSVQTFSLDLLPQLRLI